MAAAAVFNVFLLGVAPGWSSTCSTARSIGAVRMTTSSPVDSPAPSLDGEPRGAAHVDDDPLAERLYERERQKWTWDVRTDDGLALDSRDLRQRRSDWVRDLISIGDSRISESLSERLSAAVLSCSLVDALAAVDQTASWASHGALTAAVAMPSWPHEAVGGFLAILLVFRTDQAYDRFWEARGLWADVDSAVRNIGLLATSHFPPGDARDLLLAHAATFPFALKQHLRGTRDLSRLEEAWMPYAGPRLGEERARAELRAMAEEDSLPAAVVESLSAEVSVLLRASPPEGYECYATDEQGQRQAALWAQLQSRVEALTAVTEGCERLKLTPIPWAYARQTSRYCSLFLLSLPFALLDSGAPLWQQPLIVLGFGYVLYGLEEIGHLIEEPFSLAFLATDSPASGAAERRRPTNPVALGARALLAGARALGGGLRALTGIEESNEQVVRRSVELEVLPLRKYCYTAHLELASLAAQRAQREQRNTLYDARGHGGVRRGLPAMRHAVRAGDGDGDGDGDGGSALDDPARYRAIAEAATVRLKLIGDRSL